MLLLEPSHCVQVTWRSHWSYSGLSGKTLNGFGSDQHQVATTGDPKWEPLSRVRLPLELWEEIIKWLFLLEAPRFWNEFVMQPWMIRIYLVHWSVVLTKTKTCDVAYGSGWPTEKGRSLSSDSGSLRILSDCQWGIKGKRGKVEDWGKKPLLYSGRNSATLSSVLTWNIRYIRSECSSLGQELANSFCKGPDIIISCLQGIPPLLHLLNSAAIAQR